MTSHAFQRPIVAITGLSQSGKDTAGAHLVVAHGFARYAFATKLKEAAYAIDPLIRTERQYVTDFLDRGDRVLHIRLQKLVDHLGWDAAKQIPEVGRILQAVGTEGGWMIHGRDVWTTLCERDFESQLADQPSTPVVITDLRFPHEETWLRERNGLLIRIVRPEQHRASTRDQKHSSERGQSGLNVDFTIINDGSLSKLYDAVDDVLAGKKVFECIDHNEAIHLVRGSVDDSNSARDTNEDPPTITYDDRGLTVDVRPAHPDLVDDGGPEAIVVQIDTGEKTGRLRVNLNDGPPVWDGDPEQDEQPGRYHYLDPDNWSNALPKAIADCLCDRQEPEGSATATWLRKHENDDQVWSAINRLFDELQDLANERI
ncbi:hypothetical protein [Arthrobacter bambusae]|uniref:Dephospho-CoA kinase n=1 Tax=Arthrobacter bambusae TaxID=1338426 RepID=A0AAW8D9L3_9MICC|nr:hypothetical protein [Arthrobacter bambusae]MDP9903163.1 hypothetical protein [Arthrobacter bambusae]MDQ0128843.1 hypothetical protein [Arthrobacter bambusae]MDQ0180184.1 hypothetical protein [Arthrobacter bambusae]